MWRLFPYLGIILGLMSASLACSPEPLELSKHGAKRKPIIASEVKAGRQLGRLDLTQRAGQRSGVPCGTCHTTPPSWEPVQDPAQLAEFHTQMRFEHGSNRCGSCHDLERRDQLKLADGTSLPFEETMTLCAQCHGGQARDYAAGAHGGMSGTWDTKYGPRTRNHCTNCHDPHAPAYPSVMPAPPPRDRFLTKPHH